VSKSLGRNLEGSTHPMLTAVYHAKLPLWLDAMGRWGSHRGDGFLAFRGVSALLKIRTPGARVSPLSAGKMAPPAAAAAKLYAFVKSP
jgi:hypothetical protein